MGLKLAAHKSYHPAKQSNIARVERDERNVAENREKQLETERTNRINELRKKAGLAAVEIESAPPHTLNPTLQPPTFKDLNNSSSWYDRAPTPRPKDLSKLDPLTDMNRYIAEAEEWESQIKPDLSENVAISELSEQPKRKRHRSSRKNTNLGDKPETHRRRRRKGNKIAKDSRK